MKLPKTMLFFLAAAVLGLAAAAVVQAAPVIEGNLHLLVERADPGAFGLADARGQSFLAPLHVVMGDGSVIPWNGSVRGQVAKFSLQIGDTSWDETMGPNGAPLVFEILFGDGSVKGLAGEITPYNPAHPDLYFFLPHSPGTWSAVDQRLLVDPETGRQYLQDRGAVSGTYSADLRVVPLPGGLSLLGLGLSALLARRRR